MNLHFRRDAEWDYQLPSSVFARLDHVVPPGPASESVLLAFDAIDAEWVKSEGTRDPRFNLDDPNCLIAAWSAAKIDIVEDSPKNNPLESAPLYRIEVELPVGTAPFGFPDVPDYEDTSRNSGLSALETAWFQLYVSRQANGGTVASLYPALFAPPVSVYVTGTMPSVQQGRALSGIFSLANLPTISTAQFAQILAVGSADYLAVYDVGQGNSNALLKASGVKTIPTLYYDLGAGVYRNQHTTPQQLIFCFTQRPPIVLSHWDADHWAGAYANSVNGRYPALTQTWIAPMQLPGPVHIAFAYDILANGGNIYTYSPAPATLGAVVLQSGHRLRFAVGVGSDRNNTGIVVCIEHLNLNPPRSWLLTGDCDYTYFVPHLAPLPPIALVAPHHGATLGAQSTAPSPLATSTYRRLIYSFGAGNKHGGTNVQHPTHSGVQLHASSGWQHGAWATCPPPGSCQAGGDVLETEIHGTTGQSGTQLGGCLIDWNSPPPPVTPPCGAVSCSTSPVRS